MSLPSILGVFDALTPEEQERVELAVANVNRAYVDAHRDDSMEMLATDYLAARQDTLDLLRQFTDEQLAAPLPTVVGDHPPATSLSGGQGMQPSISPRLRKDSIRACRWVSFFAALQFLDQMYRPPGAADTMRPDE